MAQEKTTPAFGQNAWLVDEMYEQFRQDPASVSASWQEFFADYRPTMRGNGSAVQTAVPPSAPPAAPPAPSSASASSPPSPATTAPTAPVAAKPATAGDGAG